MIMHFGVGSLLFLAGFVIVTAGQAGSKLKDSTESKRTKSADKIKVLLSGVEITLVDPESGKPSSTQKISDGGKLPSTLNVLENQRLQVKFTVKHGNNAVKADQAFIRLTHPKADMEVVTVADIDGDGYKGDLDIAKKASEFSRLSGTYELRIDVGDVDFSNAISAHLGSVKLNFVSGVTDLPDPLSRYQPKPEIKHLFREPEKRPLAIVSTAFSFAVLAPVLILLGLWTKVGINIKNFDFHPSALVFYGSLGAIFFLYLQFWIFLDMFTTLKYLSALGAITLLSGSTFFARMYRRRTGKEIKE